MPEAEHTSRTFFAGPIWRDSNVRSGPSLSSPVIKLLLPDGETNYEAEGWTIGDSVTETENKEEGVIVSEIWLKLSIGGWCSAVNFHPQTMAQIPQDAEIKVDR